MKPIIIAGPCAVESEKQVFDTAFQIKNLLTEQDAFEFQCFRAGIWKPRSTPADFAGVGTDALPWLQRIQNELGLKVCVEIAQPEHVEICRKAGINMFWIGARTTVNPFQVEKLAQLCQGSEVCVFVKNPVSPDLKLWLGAVERFETYGIKNVFAVHRGFDLGLHHKYRNTPYWKIPIEFLKQRPDIPMIGDPSHIAGCTSLIEDICQKSLDLGYSGLMIETHITPEEALSDKHQQITPKMLWTLLQRLHIQSKNKTENQNPLFPLRSEMEDIDNQIMFLMKSRLEISEQIAQIKQKHQLPILQPTQWEKVENSYMEFARQEQIDENLMKEFLKILHLSSLKRQERI